MLFELFSLWIIAYGFYLVRSRSKGNVATCQFSRKTYLVALADHDRMKDKSDFSAVLSC